MVHRAKDSLLGYKLPALLVTQILKGDYCLRIKRAADVLSHPCKHLRPCQLVRATTTTGIEW